ncbi:ATP-dependent helicase [Athalassotoga saccharophila]|uniref:DNA 3'-5' helicase n=1 Tax=Athalassotoga saccharophila TaxID=1441386 RepID=A0A6N4TFV8_9BACT|nr:ATP-dependent DNA helicase [Athalassotoga saccharophila]BBJ29062.1 ATP-dependent DNA helicase PcrA [Athalassotoga saccharophila]
MIKERIGISESNLEKEILSKPSLLSDSQKEAVLSDSRYVKITAGAGAGKTETLTRKIIYLLLVKNIDPVSIVAFTFTEKAAENIKNRIYHRILEYGREDIAKHLGKMYVGTIHGFCLRVLQEKFSNNGYGNYNVFDANQEMAFIFKIGRKILGMSNHYIDSCFKFIENVNVVYGEYIDKETLRENAVDFYKKLIKYEELLNENKYFTFGRIIYECVQNLEKYPEKLADVKYLIVDEFQDIDKAQFNLIRLIGKNASVFVVGDPRQSIYKWRGADEEFFNSFEKYFKHTKSLEINGNRRSGSKIVEAANAFADSFEGINFPNMEAVKDETGDVKILSFDMEEDEAEWIAAQIKELVDNHGFRYSDFAILLRSVKNYAKAYIEALKKLEIPYIIGGKVGLFRRDDALAVGMLITWLDGSSWKMYNKKIEGDNLLREGIQHWKNAVRFELPSDLEEKLRKWKKDFQDKKFKTFKDIYYELLLVLGYKNLDPNNKLDVAILANLGRVSTIIRDFDITRRLTDKRNPSWPADLHEFVWFIRSYAINSYEELTPDQFSGIDVVQVITVHQAKGLEWPVVFLPSLVDKRFPSEHDIDDDRWMIPEELFNSGKYNGGIEDEKRLFYVAMTRAKKAVLFSYFKTRTPRINSSNPIKVSKSKFVDILLERTQIQLTKSTYLDYTIDRNQEDNEDEIHSYSVTELINYMLCPYHYRLNNLWGYMQSMSSQLLGYGEALHYVLRRTSELMNQGYSATSAVNTAMDDFYLPFASDKVFDNIKENTKKILKNFVVEYQEDMKKISEVEMRVELPLENSIIVGRVDVILKDEDAHSYEIRDYKTSDEIISKEDYEFQIRLYTHALRNLDYNVESGSIAFLTKSEVSIVEIDENKVEMERAKAEEIVRKIKNSEFPMEPRKNFCERCEYKKICKGAKFDGSQSN